MKPEARFVFDEITKLYPDAHCELNFANELELLIAILLSAQTTDISVNQATPRLFSKYRTVDEYASASVEDIEAILLHLGLYKNKARFVHAACLALRDRFGGIIPSDQESLESLPGVGRKTANVFLAEWFHQPRIAVDTHVGRVSVRLGLADEGDSPEKIEKILMEAFDENLWIDLHHRLLFFGRYFCTARQPKCQDCPFRKLCKYPK